MIMCFLLVDNTLIVRGKKRRNTHSTAETSLVHRVFLKKICNWQTVNNSARIVLFILLS